MSTWNVKSDVERAQWAFTPLVSVGPLRFEMRPDEVDAALDGAIAAASNGVRVQMVSKLGVTAYYTESTQLACVAVDALIGPQVEWAGTTLVGRVPSEMEMWILHYAKTQGLDLRYTHEGNPELADLGLVIRVQRAADIVLTRPLFCILEWAQEVYDYIPGFEWSTF